MFELPTSHIPYGVVVERSGTGCLVVAYRPSLAQGAGCVRIPLILLLVALTAVTLGVSLQAVLLDPPRASVEFAIALWLCELLLVIQNISYRLATTRFTFTSDSLVVRSSRLRPGAPAPRTLARADLRRIELVGSHRSEILVYLPTRTELLRETVPGYVSPWLAQVLSLWSGVPVENTEAARGVQSRSDSSPSQ